MDLTAQVRLERSLLPRPSVYLAVAERLLHDLRELHPRSLGRRAEIRQLITGDPDAEDLPVVLVSERTVSKRPGVYQLDDLRASEQAIDRMLSGVDAPHVVVDDADDVVVIEDDPTPNRALEPREGTVLTRAPRRVRLVPQGIFPLDELTSSLAVAGTDEDSAVDAIRSTRPVGPIESTVQHPQAGLVARVLHPLPELHVHHPFDLRPTPEWWCDIRSTHASSTSHMEREGTGEGGRRGFGVLGHGNTSPRDRRQTAA